MPQIANRVVVKRLRGTFTFQIAILLMCSFAIFSYACMLFVLHSLKTQLPELLKKHDLGNLVVAVDALSLPDAMSLLKSDCGVICLLIGINIDNSTINSILDVDGARAKRNTLYWILVALSFVLTVGDTKGVVAGAVIMSRVLAYLALIVLFQLRQNEILADYFAELCDRAERPTR